MAGECRRRLLLAGAALAAGEEGGTPLFDRVRRIVTPDQRPHVRIPWYTFLGVTAAYALLSVGIYEGADATV